MPTVDKKKAMELRCSECGHHFDGPLLPMQMGRCAEYLSGIHCPSCGADGNHIFMVKTDKAGA